MENRLTQIVRQLSQEPDLFAPGEPHFWDDPYISEQLLAAHLDPTREAASRPHDIIEQEVNWLLTRLTLRPGDPVLDLGCGPGLYCTRFAAKGLEVTGVDYSPTSIAYARKAAQELCLAIRYRQQNYLTLDDQNAFQAIFLIYGDFCALRDEQRGPLLDRIHRALRSGGYFAFDVTTPAMLQQEPPNRTWSIHDGGFWRPGSHLVLQERFIYPKESVSLDQYLVIEADCVLALYRLWLRHYTAETLRPLLEEHGFGVVEIVGDLRGAEYAPASPWMGILAQKPPLGGEASGPGTAAREDSSAARLKHAPSGGRA